MHLFMNKGYTIKYLQNQLLKTSTEDVCSTNNRLLYDNYGIIA